MSCCVVRSVLVAPTEALVEFGVVAAAISAAATALLLVVASSFRRAFATDSQCSMAARSLVSTSRPKWMILRTVSSPPTLSRRVRFHLQTSFLRSRSSCCRYLLLLLLLLLLLCPLFSPPPPLFVVLLLLALLFNVASFIIPFHNRHVSMELFCFKTRSRLRACRLRCRLDYAFCDLPLFDVFLELLCDAFHLHIVLVVAGHFKLPVMIGIFSDVIRTTALMYSR